MKERNVGIDVIKAYCIILVVLCHTVEFPNLPTPIGYYFNTVFLRCFFMVSGYLMLKQTQEMDKSYGQIVKKRFVYYFKIYAIYSVIATIWHGVICVGFHNPYVSDTYSGIKIVLRDIFCAITGLGIGTLWFLPVIFITVIFVQGLIWLLNKTRIRTQGMVLCVGVLLFLIVSILLENYNIVPETLWMKILDEFKEMFYRIAYGIAYTILGYFLHMLLNKSRKVYDIVCVAGILVSIVLFGIYTYVCKTENLSLQMANEILLSLSTFVVIMKLSALVNKSKIGAKILIPFAWIGKKSLDITIYHYIFLLPIEMIWFRGWGLFILNLVTAILLIYSLDKIRTLKVQNGE